MAVMNSKQIEKNCGFLGEKLEEWGIEGKVVIVGGAFMLLEVKSRKTTHDIDVIIVASDHRHYKIVQDAIAEVAWERRLSRDWMNDNVAIITDQIGAPKRIRLWKQFKALSVFVPEPAYILALKLFSGRDRDDQDIQALASKLKVKTKAQAWKIMQAQLHPQQLANPERRVIIADTLDRNFDR